MDDQRVISAELDGYLKSAIGQVKARVTQGAQIIKDRHAQHLKAHNQLIAETQESLRAASQAYAQAVERQVSLVSAKVEADEVVARELVKAASTIKATVLKLELSPKLSMDFDELLLQGQLEASLRREEKSRKHLKATEEERDKLKREECERDSVIVNLENKIKELTKNFRQNSKGQDAAVRETNAALLKRNKSLERAAKKDETLKGSLHRRMLAMRSRQPWSPWRV
jgi:hypothetical protein